MDENSRGFRRLRQRIGIVALGLVACGSALRAQTVTIPLEQYDRLRAKAYPPAAESPPPDVGLSFESADLAVVVDDGRARITAKLSFWLHAEGWQEVTWPATLPLGAARAATCEVRLASDPNGRRLVLRGPPGRHQLELESALEVSRSVTATRPTSSLHLPLPVAARVSGTIETSEEVSSDELALLERTGPRLWRFAGSGGGTVLVTLAGAPEVSAPERPLRYDVTTATALVLQRTRRQAEAWITGQVIEGKLDRLSIPTPAGFEVVSVEGGEHGGDVAWEVREGGPLAGGEGLGAFAWEAREGRIFVDFPAAAPKRWQLRATLAADTAEESSVPLLLPEGARRTFVVTKVEARGGGILERADSVAARPLEPNEVDRLPEAFRSRPGEALVSAADGPTPRWRVTWPTEARVLGAQVDRLLVDVLVGEHGRAFYQVWAVVRANGAPDLALELPAGARLVESRRDGVAARLGRRGSAWVSPLVSRDAEQILFWSAEVSLPWPTADGGRLELPMPSSSSPISTVEVRAGLPAAFRYEWVDPSRRGPVGGVPSPFREHAGANQLGQQLYANVAVKLEPIADDLGWQPLPAGFQVLTATWSSLDTTPSPLVLNVRRSEEARR